MGPLQERLLSAIGQTWVNPETVLAIRNSPIHIDTLFAEEHLKTAEAEL